MKIKTQYCLLFLLMAMTKTSSAQNGVNSPYSRYGFGIQSDRSMGFNKGMAGVAQGFRESSIINTANPASYSDVDSLTALFDLGLTFSNGNYKMGSLQHNAKNTNLDYAAFHFRATKGLGVALGVLPYTNINYSFSSNSEDVTGTDDITSSYSYSGSGGLHQAFLGLGWQVFKPLSIGVNGSYLFGDYSHSMTMSFSESGAYSIIRGYDATINTWMADFGLQYSVNIGKNDKVVIGATYGLGHDVNNQAIRYTETYNSSSSSVEGISGDTIKNAFQLPHTFAVGLTYYKNNILKVGADFELQKWSKCKFPTQAEDGVYTSSVGQLNDKMKITVGGEYTPNYKYKTTRPGRLLSYKLGGYYSKSYANTDQTGTISDKPYEYGVSAGVTIPIANKNLWYNMPKLNLSVQWVHTNIPYLTSTGTSRTVSKLTENYLKFTIGLTFSERWFYKWRMQ